MERGLRIEEERPPDLEAYASIPIGYPIESRLDLPKLTASGGTVLVEVPTEPRWKDYDEFPDERPTALPQRFDTTNWGVLAAFDGDRRVGGAIVACRTPDFDMLQGREDLAVLVDLRVHPDVRGRGVGRALFAKAAEWARSQGSVEMIVETQDTNVAACRFYSAMGAELVSVEPGAYGEELDEAKVMWRWALGIGR